MKLLIICLMTILFFSCVCLSQPETSDSLKTRPKIGLVLSGGGAKGLAHIGVLKVLEEVGIVPDFITGTSMGSIVGGLYAIGYSAEEISTINRTMAWGEYLSNSTSLRRIDMIRKADYSKYPLEFPIHDRKVYLPSGVIESPNFWQFFQNITWDALGTYSFDSFPIPFRCVATEIVEARQKTFNNGSLPIALRASMAIPGFFSPVIEGDSLIYVDGGVCKNFPVDEAIQMGADIIIGVYVGTPHDININKAKTIDQILMQTAFFSGIRESRESMDKCDILIMPDMKKFGAQSFDKGAEIELIGEQEARKHIQELKALADSVYGKSKSPQVKRLCHKNYVLSGIEVHGIKTLDTGFVIAKSKINATDTVNLEKLSKAVENLYGTLYFDRIAYYFLPTSQNSYRLVFDIQEKEPKLLKANVHVNNFWGPAVSFNYHHNSLLSRMGQFNAKLEISKIPRLNVEHSQFWGKKQNFTTSSKLFFENDEIPIYLQNQKIGTINENYYGLSADAGYLINNNSYLSMGAAFAVTSLYTNSSFQLLFPEESIDAAHFGGLKFWSEFKANSLDRIVFPRMGTVSTISISCGVSPWLKIEHRDDSGLLDSVSKPGNYVKVISSYEYNFSPLNGLSIMFGGDFRFNTDKTPAFDYTFIGGFDNINRSRDISFYGLGYRQINLSNLYILKSELRYKIWKELYGLGRINYMQGTNTLKNIFADTFNPEFDIFGYALGIGYKALIGPINFWYAANTANRTIWAYFSVGFTF